MEAPNGNLEIKASLSDENTRFIVTTLLLGEMSRYRLYIEALSLAASIKIFYFRGG